MLQRFTRVSKVCLLAAAVMSLAAGPSAAVAEARYEFRAWAAKVEAARKSKSPAQNTGDSNESDAGRSPGDTPSGSDRSFNCFYVPTSAKPSDTKTPGNTPLFARVPELRFASQPTPQVISTAPLNVPSPNHHPAHRAQAPPRA